ncbi:MAG TPA: DUF3108 domain-containing protein [Campylobacterales bacterium]|nr:DUF3108 domain-containing protein [Campylobacterales bacterium]
MKKISLMFVSLLFVLNITEAKTIEVDYKVEFGIIGEIGVAHAKLTRHKRSYVIDIQLQSTGLAKTLSGNRRERHISKGHIEKGLMVSDLYQIIKSHGSKTSDRVYTIDHHKKKVTRVDEKYKNGKIYKKRTKVMDDYSKDDLLTLYFNLNSYIKDKNSSKDYRFHAVGAEIQDGFVDIHIPNSSELPEYKKMLGDYGSWYARAIVNQKIFSSDKGELMLSIGNDGITNKAVLKDLIFFGDIRAFRVK